MLHVEQQLFIYFLLLFRWLSSRAGEFYWQEEQVLFEKKKIFPKFSYEIDNFSKNSQSFMK